MKLPQANRAVVEPRKIRDYLLSPSHPVGRFKAAFFAALGYTQSEWQELGKDLQGHALAGDAVEGDSNIYGQKYEVRGILVGPTGRDMPVVTVWIILQGEDFPRFVTAFPGPRP